MMLNQLKPNKTIALPELPNSFRKGKQPVSISTAQVKSPLVLNLDVPELREVVSHCLNYMTYGH